ncbi:MAG: aldehyde dehydrogenase family protein, partial [Actinomycetota bacterium]
MVKALESYLAGSWRAPRDEGVVVRDAATGEDVARVASAGIDARTVIDHARKVGGPGLRSRTFHERAAILKSLATLLTEKKKELYALSLHTGATRPDSAIDIDGGIGTLFSYASKGRRELPDDTVYLDGPPEQIGKKGSFYGQHVFTSREGVALQVNAFNFPCWGFLEKLAPAFLAGIPTIVKPATPTAYLTELVVRQILESGLMPEGTLQLLLGRGDD